MLFTALYDFWSFHKLCKADSKNPIVQVRAVRHRGILQFPSFHSFWSRIWIQLILVPEPVHLMVLPPFRCCCFFRTKLLPLVCCLFDLTFCIVVDAAIHGWCLFLPSASWISAFELGSVQETSFQLISYSLALRMFLCVLNVFLKTFYYFFCKDAYRRSTYKP